MKWRFFETKKQPFNMIKNLIFDFGGVIVDCEKEGAIKHFTEIGLPNANTYFGQFSQTGIFGAIEEGELTAQEFCTELGKLCQKEISFKEAQYGWMGFVAGMDEQKLTFLENLRKEYRLLLLSNTNPFVMEWARSKQFCSMKKPLDDYFDRIFTSYELGSAKPNKAIFEKMIKKAEINPQESLFIDDGEKNIATAQALGLHTFQPENASDWRASLTQLLSAMK
jgi:putative hydrolase of the HAD superfamily